MKIYNRFTKKVIFECEKITIKETVMKAIKSNTDLSEADLSRADLSGADLSGTNLSRANLSRADLSRADLSGSRLCNAKFEKTKISYRGEIVKVNFRKI